MLEKLQSNVKPLDKLAMKVSKEHWDHIGKPIEGLGKLEDLIIQIAGIQGTEQVNIEKKAVVVMCSDNGVVEEGVTQTDQEVTALVTENFGKGIASVNVMAKASGAYVFPVDIGVARDINQEGVLNKKIAYGTKNMAKGPAMTKEQAIRAIQTGFELVQMLKEEGFSIIGTGEMGIGNTSTSSAIISVLLDVPVETVTGPGAGLSKDGVRHKIDVIKEAIALNQPKKEEPLDVLCKVGGLDIAGLTGVFLGGAIAQIPIVMDGVISLAAALLARAIDENAISYMIPSHLGKEPAMQLAMKELGLDPIIHGNLALGEGTGTTLLFPMLDLAMSVYNQNKTFSDIHVEEYHRFDQDTEEEKKEEVSC
ncbi:nicotinate-nucleotide--dimethylbenzimidazole phosphoribosyltransferase [[Clostridium] polysaccharolyticum]|uniref:Nicotinate-nucleotide--dimethylbenzimidazole phosphoribosyltransferase n=1 Tax=[Clostridium] polysaccharolyticum TaxID=29364 RepID=A0A1I0B9H7_9FIRM|nr:nicotinate-nucleotide--dimethylbenzimidazole phosphoribosyltransferase [[Clostridium] polysaccharolyticum]SET03420.1 nicotinate-nucleotide-dimethylbenzimidazole phosphoribosyltransferase [[Clostridium] polysaccharolyticum]